MEAWATLSQLSRSLCSERQDLLVSMLAHWISFWKTLCFCLVFNVPPDQMASELPCLLSCDRAWFHWSRLKSRWNFKKVDGRTGIVTHSASRSLGRYLSSRLSVIALLSQLSRPLRHSLKSMKGGLRSSRLICSPAFRRGRSLFATGASTASVTIFCQQKMWACTGNCWANLLKVNPLLQLIRNHCLFNVFVLGWIFCPSPDYQMRWLAGWPSGIVNKYCAEPRGESHKEKPAHREIAGNVQSYEWEN